MLGKLKDINKFRSNLAVIFHTMYIFESNTTIFTQNVLMATCFDSESSSGLPKNRSNVSKFCIAFWDPKRLEEFGIPECTIKF
jgi:hypothetical protein